MPSIHFGVIISQSKTCMQPCLGPCLLLINLHRKWIYLPLINQNYKTSIELKFEQLKVVISKGFGHGISWTTRYQQEDVSNTGPIHKQVLVGFTAHSFRI